MTNGEKAGTMVSLSIDGIDVQVRQGATILSAARKAGVQVSTLCFLRGTSAIGSCRVCSVEVEGVDGLVPACNTPVRNGMRVSTNSQRVLDWRRLALGLVLADLGKSANALPEGSQLRELCEREGVTEPAFNAEHTREQVLDCNPFLSFDPNLCIRCQRCVGACNNVARNHTLHTAHEGARLSIRAPFGADWKSTLCESCGNCAAACPTGAIALKRLRGHRPDEIRKVLTTCPHCAVGCQLNLLVKEGRIVGAEGADGPSNGGRLCVKGRSASFDFVHSPDRLTMPLVKDRITGRFHEASWDEALDLVARRLAELRDEHGGQALAAFACSRSTNEDIYLLQKMARVALRTNNVDNCARV